jgi:hypothetical protein
MGEILDLQFIYINTIVHDKNEFIKNTDFLKLTLTWK